MVHGGLRAFNLHWVRNLLPLESDVIERADCVALGGLERTEHWAIFAGREAGWTRPRRQI